MKAKLRSMLSTTTGRYITVGGLVYLLELVVIWLSETLGASSLVAVGVSFWIGLVASFLLQKLFTFGDKRTQRKVLLSQIIAVSLLVMFNFGFTLLITKLFASTLTTFGARTVALAITVIWNFYLYKTHIFRVGKEPIID